MDKRQLILYGAGCVGKALVEKLMRFKIHIECLCDADPAKRGIEYFGYVVKSIDEVKAQYKKGEYSLFVSVTPYNAGRVKNNLICQGIFDAFDFCNDSLDELIISRMPDNGKNNREKREHCISMTEKNYIQLNSELENSLKKTLLATRFSDENYMRTENGKQDFFDHLYGRLNMYRSRMIPWLESIRSIKGAKILEIGCGTGASTLALCEQGACVTAVDLDEWGLEIARKRIEIYGLKAEIIKLSAVDIKTRFYGGFDFIIYAASIEHMTYTERIQTIKAAYDMLDNGQYIIVVDTPNRLWHTDSHTSKEPFYYWLPDALAMDYAKFTSREKFNQEFGEDSEDNLLKFARWGRGVSYHEFEAAIGRGRLKAISNMDDFFDLPDSLYKKLLKINGPEHICDGFYVSTLNIALGKTI